MTVESLTEKGDRNGGSKGQDRLAPPLPLAAKRNCHYTLTIRDYILARFEARARPRAVYPARARLTCAETLPISARPDSLGLSRAMTLPMSCGPLAPAV